jgi:hypothetical protein
MALYILNVFFLSQVRLYVDTSTLWHYHKAVAIFLAAIGLQFIIVIVIDCIFFIKKKTGYLIFYDYIKGPTFFFFFFFF